MAASSTTGRVGYRLNDARIRHILSVTLALIAELGYERMSIDEVARRARTSKATLYRRWRSKTEIAVAAVLQHTAEKYAFAPAMTLRDDLLALTAAFCDGAKRNRDLTLGILSVMHTDAQFMPLVLQRSFEAMQPDIAAMLERAAWRGEIPPVSNPAMLFEMLEAIISLRLLAAPSSLDSSFAESLVDAVLLPVLRGAGSLPPFVAGQ